MGSSQSRQCIICKGENSDKWARPECCNNHWFHLECLKIASSVAKKCPLDRNSFKTIIVEDGSRIDLDSDSDSFRLSDLIGSPGSMMVDHMLSLSMLMMQQIAQASANDDIQEIQCDICNTKRSGQIASTDSCGHKFHRDCLSNHSGRELLCPKPGCYAEYSSTISNDEIDGTFSSKPTIANLSFKSAPTNFKCSICQTRDKIVCRARAEPCSHEFHRACLIEKIRVSKTCPVCNANVRNVNCLMGPTIRADRIRIVESES